MNTQTHHKPIFVALSGGVDSAVSAFLLKEMGTHVIGVFMKNWEENGTSPCPASLDMADARTVCDHLKIEFRTVNFSDAYWQHVFTDFLDNYAKGRTPNPDILCNREIKFHAFLHYVKQQQADAMATGHYVQSCQDNQIWKLCKGKDKSKDQSYFLYTLTQEALSHSIFPIGHLEKKQVRNIAKKAGLKNHAKKDSTGICFIGERKFNTFLKEYLPTCPGEIHSLEGEVIGKHEGLMFYTIGQRKGLHIGGQKGKPEAPWYVVRKDISRNVLIAAQGEHPALYTKILRMDQPHWIQNLSSSLPFRTAAKIRYRQNDQPCYIEQTSNEEYQVIFDQPQRAITPGQSIVFYDDEVCLGGGIIIPEAFQF